MALIIDCLLIIDGTICSNARTEAVSFYLTQIWLMLNVLQRTCCPVSLWSIGRVSLASMITYFEPDEGGIAKLEKLFSCKVHM